MMTVWTVRITLGSPIVLPQAVPLVGDALLSAAEAKRLWPQTMRTRQPVAQSDWMPRIPLPVAEDQGHWATSCVWFEGPAYREEERFYKTADARVVRPKEAGSGFFKMGVQQPVAWVVPQIAFDVGFEPAQEAALQQLLQRYLPRVSVGALGRMGYGRIVHVDWEPSRQASAVWTADGQPRRPIRVTALPANWQRDPQKTVLWAMRAEPPRWWGPVEWCVVPHFDQWWPQELITRGGNQPNGDEDTEDASDSAEGDIGALLG